MYIKYFLLNRCVHILLYFIEKKNYNAWGCANTATIIILLQQYSYINESVRVYRSFKKKKNGFKRTPVYYIYKIIVYELGHGGSSNMILLYIIMLFILVYRSMGGIFQGSKTKTLRYVKNVTGAVYYTKYLTYLFECRASWECVRFPNGHPR